jgi:hypothetical protein
LLRAFRRSTTSACSPAATTWTCWPAPGSDARSTATATPPPTSPRRWTDPRSVRWPGSFGSATPILPSWERSPALMPPTAPSRSAGATDHRRLESPRSCPAAPMPLATPPTAASDR